MCSGRERSTKKLHHRAVSRWCPEREGTGEHVTEEVASWRGGVRYAWRDEAAVRKTGRLELGIRTSRHERQEATYKEATYKGMCG